MYKETMEDYFKKISVSSERIKKNGNKTVLGHGVNICDRRQCRTCQSLSRQSHTQQPRPQYAT